MKEQEGGSEAVSGCGVLAGRGRGVFAELAERLGVQLWSVLVLRMSANWQAEGGRDKRIWHIM